MRLWSQFYQQIGEKQVKTFYFKFYALYLLCMVKINKNQTLWISLNSEDWNKDKKARICGTRSNFQRKQLSVSSFILVPSCVESFSPAEGEKCVPPVLEHGTVVTASGGDPHGGGDPSGGRDPSGGGDPRGGDLWVGHFACDPGYLLVGAASLKCRAGTWSSQTPKCTGRCYFIWSSKTRRPQMSPIGLSSGFVLSQESHATLHLKFTDHLRMV